MPSSTFIILPALALISIPLVISAYITIIFSILALWIRLSVIYIELCYAIITNFFVIPTSSDSLLTFISSEPASPLSTSFRSISTLNGPSTCPSSSRRSARPRAQRYNSSTSLDNFVINNHKPQNPFSSLISGDQARDFEDMGGWRCLAPRSQNQNQNRDSSNSPPSPSNQASINGVESAEERAWLSINNRLELPSHILTLSEPTSWSLSAPPLPVNTMSMSPQRRRHHKRSVTTSMLCPSRGWGGGLSLSLSNRPDTPSAPATPGNYHQRLSQSALVGPSDSYFPLQECTTSEKQMSGTTTPRTVASIEDRSAGLGLGRFMAHYPAGVRHRRRSISGISRAFGRD